MNKKLTIKSAIVLLFAVAMTSLCLFGCSQPAASSSSSAGSTSSASSVAAAEMPVTVEIDPSAAAGKVYLPEADLTIITDELAIPEDSTAYDALVATGAELEGSESYVTAINGLAEKAAGATYGWMYEVNGEQPLVSANEYVVESDDVVRWYYASWEE